MTGCPIHRAFAMGGKQRINPPSLYRSCSFSAKSYFVLLFNVAPACAAPKFPPAFARSFIDICPFR